MTGNHEFTWEVYRPDAGMPWNRQRVSHLHRRAGFGATWEELQRDLEDGPQEAINRLLAGEAYTTGVPADFSNMSDVIADAAVAAGHPERLKAWWCYRMVFSPDPLTERLAMMWHNHFATSNLKVADVGLMREQNELFRSCGRRPFGELLQRVVKHPAMLVWLDADSNRQQHPNENLARELMELFSVGVGRFTEDDVKNAARALTGWTARRGQFRQVAAYHDGGEKSFLGKQGAFAGDDILEMVLADEGTEKRLAWRLCSVFFGENVVGDKLLDELAADLRANGLDVGWAVERILRSEAFFSNPNLGSRVLGPVEFVVGAVRALEMFDPPPSTLVLAEWTARLGQDLFYPPNVFGWRGGRDWLTTRSLIGRAAFAAQLAEGGLGQPQGGAVATQGRDWDLESLVQRISELLVVSTSDRFCRRVVDAVSANPPEGDSWRQVCQAVLASPEAQLG